ncbi:hypothetical protein G6F56_008737 [Rhizopus delemar]|nr:hypothetical protein G6F56_008737 [Rhizopus delemar]
MDLIYQQIENNVFDIENIIRYLTDTMASMCAPVRDNQVEKIRQLATEPIEQLKLMSDLLDAMSLDLSNFRLRSLRRPLMTIAVDYEREKFAEMLNNGMIQLVKTQHWLSCHAQKKPVFEEAFVSLLEQPTLLTAETLPETLMLDVQRMSEFQNEFQANTLVATLLTLTRNFGPTSSLDELGVRFFRLLEDKETVVDNLAAEIERCVGLRNRKMIRAMVDKTLSHTDPIYNILSHRIGSVIKSTIIEGKFNAESVTHQGLEFIQPTLQLLSLRILKLVRHHRQVYTDWYNELISKQ